MSLCFLSIGKIDKEGNGILKHLLKQNFLVLPESKLSQHPEAKPKAYLLQALAINLDKLNQFSTLSHQLPIVLFNTQPQEDKPPHSPSRYFWSPKSALEFHEYLKKEFDQSRANQNTLKSLSRVKRLLIENKDSMKNNLFEDLTSALNQIDKEMIGHSKHEEQHNTHELLTSMSLSEMIETLHLFKRTGVLSVTHSTSKESGKITFVSGKIITAFCSPISGSKALYRMFCWEVITTDFKKSYPTTEESYDPIEESTNEILTKGEKTRHRFAEIKDQLPPKELKLKVNTEEVNKGGALSHSQFETTCSVVEFHEVSQILDYTSLEDINVYENLLYLRNKNLIQPA